MSLLSRFNDVYSNDWNMLVLGCAEIIKDHKALTYTLKPKDLEEAAEMACKLKASDINTVFPDVSNLVLSAVCITELTFIFITDCATTSCTIASLLGLCLSLNRLCSAVVHHGACATLKSCSFC